MPTTHRVWRSLLILALLLALLLPACSRPKPAPAATGSPTAGPTPTATATPRPVYLTLWHYWPDDQADTIRGILDEFQESRPEVRVEMVYQADILAALAGLGEGDGPPDIVALPGDRVPSYIAAEAIAPLGVYVSAAWLDESFVPAAVDALRYDAQLWGLPLHLQTVTFIYNQTLIADTDLAAQTSELLEKAETYHAEHPEAWYLAYPAREVYFAAPWFYGAGAWYVREDGTVGLDTPAALEAATFLSDLAGQMPADLDYAHADNLFRTGQAAITVNGPWYLDELDAAGISYGLQVMPHVSSSGQPARPFVTAEGLALGARSTEVEDAVRVIAFLAGAESELQLARQHRLIPANRAAAERAGEEGMAVVAHFARQAAAGVGMPATPRLAAIGEPLNAMLQALAAGASPATALADAQAGAAAILGMAEE